MRYLNAAQAARILGIGDKTIRRWLKEGKKFPSAILTANREYAIPEGEVERVRQQRLNPQGLADLKDHPSDIAALAAKVAELEQEVQALKGGVTITEQATVQPVKDTIKTKSPQNHHSKRSEDIPEDAPAGTVKMIDFSQSSGIPASTLGRWARAGKIEVITVARVSGKGVQHFITPEGQKSAIELDKARKTEEASNPAA